MKKIRRCTKGFIQHLVPCLLAAAFMPSAAQAVNRTWTGTVDVAYTNSANWSGGVVPTNGDYGDTAVFTENSPANKTPTLYANRSVQIVKFDNSVGWTLGGGSSRTLVLRQILSSGAGLNTITVLVKTYKGTLTWTIASGNTVRLTGGFSIDDNYTTTLNGGGTLESSASITGWSSARRFKVSDGVLRVDQASPMASSGAVIIGAKTGRLQLMSTVSGAKSLIGSRILDGVGDGLAVADIGGGYVEITTKVLGTLIVVK